MNQLYNSDKPIKARTQDRFNRYKFSSRIASTVSRRKNDDGLVIGLYGIWGEGKSSVLNMIEEDLCTDSSLLIVKFNPWRFKDEDALILNFLKNIAEILNKELNTSSEKLGSFLKKYGSITSIVNIDLSKLGENLSDTDLEDLKHRVNEFLKLSDKKIVIIIDDIDRLDKQELFSLFKLIKLTGDFKNTYYILSFDDEMVASSIGERFAEGNSNSGHNFLEKIIQVPLRIPQAMSIDLLEYTFELLNDILKDNDIDLGIDENNVVSFSISQNILIRIKTPRLAIRYSNSLSFLIPILKGEINISDLILFEAVKIFYPAHYSFVKNSPEYFTESYNELFSNKKDVKKIEELNSKLEELSRELSAKENKAVLNLLQELFPIIKEALHNYSSNYFEQSWYKEKRIVISKYLNRYFNYSVAKDDISDVTFDNYIKKLDVNEFDEILNETNEMFKIMLPIEFLNKINHYEDHLNWKLRQIISNIICHNENKFEGMKGGSFTIGLSSPKSQAAITICRILNRHHDYSERLQFSKYLMSSEIPFSFSMELNKYMSVGKTEEEKVILSSEKHLLNDILLDRSLAECKKAEQNIFEKYQGYIFSLLEFWYYRDSIELQTYIGQIILVSPKKIKTIIWSLTSTIYSSSNPESYKIDFTKESFNLLKKYSNLENLYNSIIIEYSNEIETAEVVFFDHDEGQDDINAMRQFIYWYDFGEN